MDYNSLRVGRAFFCKFTESVYAQLTNPRLSTEALKRREEESAEESILALWPAENFYNHFQSLAKNKFKMAAKLEKSTW